MDTSRIGRGEMIAAVAGVALLLIMFIDWFGNDFGGANAWQSFSFIDIILFITAVTAIANAVLSANAQSVNTPVALSAIVAGLGALSVLLILFRIISPPDFGVGDVADALGVEGPDIGRKIGVWLGLIAAGGITFGGWQAMQEEGTSPGPREQRPPRDRGDSPPPPPA
jgi:hypothetical protein